MLSSNTNKLTGAAVATGLALVVGGGALTLYPDAFNSVSKIVQTKAIPNTTELKDSTGSSNLSDGLSDGAKTVATTVHFVSPLTSPSLSGPGGYYTTIAASNYSASQKATLARAVSGDSVDATTAFVRNPDYNGIVWVLDGTQPLTNAKEVKSLTSNDDGPTMIINALDTSKINDSHYYNVGVGVYYSDTNSSKQSDGTYLGHSRIVNIKATGAQLKSWSALSIKENGGTDLSAVTNAIARQGHSEPLESWLSNLNLSSDTSTWTSDEKSSIVNKMSIGAGWDSSPDILSKVLPQIMDSSN